MGKPNDFTTFTASYPHHKEKAKYLDVRTIDTTLNWTYNMNLLHIKDQSLNNHVIGKTKVVNGN